MTNKDLAHRIAYFRNKANLSAEELSGRIGKSSKYINGFESRPFNLPCNVLFDICDVCGVTPEEFFYLGHDYNERTRELFSKFNKLSEANKETIIDIINKLQ